MQHWKNLKYNKIIILSDADPDGMHIRCILLTFFFRFMKPLLEQGYVYIAQPPLYKASRGKKDYYCYNDEQLEVLKKKLGPEAAKRLSIQRYKGLGEMDAEQLWETTMNPATRRLIKVTTAEAEATAHMFDILLGDDIEGRKNIITEKFNGAVFLSRENQPENEFAFITPSLSTEKIMYELSTIEDCTIIGTMHILE